MGYERIPKDVRVRLPENIHAWARKAAEEKNQFLTEFIRDCMKEKMERADRQRMIRSTDPLIYEMAERMKAISEKMGIEQSDSEGENSAEKEG